MQTASLGTPASVLLAHGAGSGPWVFDGWADTFSGLEVAAVDLHEGLDVGRASMSDYASKVALLAAKLRPPVALCGWSMGGLVVLQATEQVQPHSVVLIEASSPGEVQGFNRGAQLVDGTFDPEEAYGRFPEGVEARPESVLARAERKRGISVPTLFCPSLVVYGDDFSEERGTALAEFYGSVQLAFPGLDHWDLVRDERVRSGIAEFLSTANC